MPTAQLATGTLIVHPHRNGFTLIEILIVMVIISIVSGVAALTINSNQHKQFETAAAKIANLVTLAEQEAMLRPATIGVAFTSDAFQFFVYQQDEKTKQFVWQPLSDSALKKHTLPSHTHITLKTENKNVAADGEPHIIITQSGDITPFVILIGKTGDAPYYQISGKANGEVISEIFHAE